MSEPADGPLPVRWGVLSTAAIAATVVSANTGSAVADVVAVASRKAARACAFADRFGIPEAFATYENLLASPRIDAVYVALPTSLHTEWTVKALEAGKHVLCEKPFALTAADAARAFDAAQAASRVCVEGFMWRQHPQTTMARRLVSEGAIGPVQLVRAALSTDVPVGNIRRDRTLGGGALLDLGCYCVSAVRLFGGEPERAYAEAVYDGVDVRLAATLRLPGGVFGQFDVSLSSPRPDELEIIGAQGILTLPDPWIGRSRELELRRDGDNERLPVPIDPASGLGKDEDAVYRLELEDASQVIAASAAPAFGRDDAVAQARVLEALNESGRSGSPVAVDGRP